MNLAQPHQTASPNLSTELSTTGQTRWLALCWGISSVGPPTFSSYPSAMHGPQHPSVTNAKIHFMYFRFWQFHLTCWSAYINHTKSSLCTLFIGPIPYQGIVRFPPQNENLLLHQMNQALQQLLVCNGVYDISRGPLNFVGSPCYILWPLHQAVAYSLIQSLYSVKHNKQL